MSGAHVALATARSAAEVARRDPSDDNLQAARAAIEAVTHRWRVDTAGMSASGHGYNPYRDKSGKFGAGAHKERPRVGKREAAVVEPHQNRPTAGHQEHTAASPRAALAKAKIAGETARANPTKANVAAAKHAVGEAAQVVGKTKRTPKAKEQDRAPAKQAVTQHVAPKPTDLTKAIGDGAIRSQDGWSVHGLTPEAQRAVRGHFDDVVGAHGLTPRPGSQSHELIGYSAEAMGGAAGWHTPTGKIAISHDGVNVLTNYGRMDHEYVGRVLADGEYHGGFNAYHVMVHETVHDHGPRLIGESARHTHMEEMTTEMAARHISAQSHGIAGHQIAHAAYGDMINGSVGHVARAAGVSREAAFDALAKASIEFKSSGTHVVHADSAMQHVASTTLKNLGANNAKTRKAVLEGWHQEAQKLVSLSDSLDASGVL